MLRWGDGVKGMMSDAKKTTFGYSMKANKPDTVNTQAPTFPPTSFIFQTHEYLKPGSSTTHDGLDEEGDKNQLLYLEMTQHKDFPVQRFLPYSGNFVTPDMDGTICINKSVFFDSYLLRTTDSMLLNILNKHTYAWVKAHKAFRDDYSSFQADLEVGPGAGNNKSDDYFAFEERTDAFGTPYWEWSSSDTTEDGPRGVLLNCDSEFREM